MKNRDLWEELNYAPMTTHKIRSKWNPHDGHAFIFGNERCDVIATTYADDTNAVQNFKLYTDHSFCISGDRGG